MADRNSGLAAETSRRLHRLGLLDPDQPTEGAHLAERARMQAPFTPAERAHIRFVLDMTGGDAND